LSVAGGKYTTYRRMAEVITDTVADRLGPRRRGRTRAFPLDGTPEQPWDVFEPAEVARLVARYNLAAATAQHLVRRYGRRAVEVAAYGLMDPSLLGPVIAGEPDVRAEFLYHRDHELAVRPADFLLRRTRLGVFHPELVASPPREVML
jgi:glycerol-3-phosphate dehydrogenase